MTIYLTNIFKWLISFAGVDGCNRCSCTTYGASCTKYVFSSFCYWPVFSFSLTKYLEIHNACVMRMILILNFRMTLILTLTSITIVIINLIIPTPISFSKCLSYFWCWWCTMLMLVVLLVMIHTFCCTKSDLAKCQLATVMGMMIMMVLLPMMMVMMLKSGSIASERLTSPLSGKLYADVLNIIR